MNMIKFEFEEFNGIEEVFLYLVSIAPYMKQMLPISSYRGYVFSLVPLTPFGNDLMMVYTKGSLDQGMVEFDVSTKKYKVVSGMERADKNYFIVLTPKKATVADTAIDLLEKSL